MAFNLQTFRTRALTAIVFVLIMLAGLLWNQWSFLLLFSIIHFGCWAEYQELAGLIDKDYTQLSLLHRYGSMLLGWTLVLWMTDSSFNVNGIMLHTVARKLFLGLAIALLVAEVLLKQQLNLRSLGYSVAGFVYLSLSWALMLDLRSSSVNVFIGYPGWVLPVVIIASIWINDTMAYIVGSFIGKTPFSSISPKKTWEGTIGGAVLAVIAVALAGHYSYGFEWKPLLLIAATAAVTGTAGDLLESKLKRMAGVKDSGQLMPGHGGFLDRFDSLLIAIPFVWLVVKLIL